MKLKSTSNLIFVLGFSIGTPLFAQTETKPAKPQKEYILDHEQLQRLHLSQKIKYIKDIQTFLVRSDFGRDPSLKTSVFSLFLEKSYAAGSEPNRCIFAGHMMTMKMTRAGGRWYCPKPPVSKDCKKNEVACNSLIFGKAIDLNGASTGKDICISEPFDNATEKCEGLMGNVENIAEAIIQEQRMPAWSYFQYEVRVYCGKPLAFNRANCETLADHTRNLRTQMNASFLKRKPKGTK